jgi:hypothetical protein
MEHLSPYRGFVICREGSYTEDSDRHVTEGPGNGTFFIGGVRSVCLLSRNLCFIYFSVIYNLEGLWPYFLPQHSKGYFSLGSGNLNPGVIRKTHPIPSLAFSKVVEGKVREYGGITDLPVEGLRASGH